jgi:hypothetical protein
VRVERDIETFDDAERSRYRECTYPDAQLHESECAKWIARAIGQPASEPGSQGEATHEAGKDGAGGMNGHAHDERKQAEPGDLKDERARSRQEIQAG